MGSFFTGSESTKPVEKNYGSVHDEAIKAIIQSLDKMYTSDSEYSRLYNALNLQSQSSSLSNYNKDILNLQLQAIDNNKQYANKVLQYQKVYAPQYISQFTSALKQADPEYWANYKLQGSQVLDDLNKGNALSSIQQRNVEQATRAAQVARGNAYGNASAAQEVYNKFMAGEQAYQNRQQAAFNFLNKSPYNGWNLSNIAAYAPAGVSGNGYNALSPYMYNNAMGVASNAANYAANNYRIQNGWHMVENNNNVPQVVGTITGSLNGAATGALTGGWVGAIIGGISGGVIGTFAQ